MGPPATGFGVASLQLTVDPDLRAINISVFGSGDNNFGACDVAAVRVAVAAAEATGEALGAATVVADTTADGAAVGGKVVAAPEVARTTGTWVATGTAITGGADVVDRVKAPIANPLAPSAMTIASIAIIQGAFTCSPRSTKAAIYIYFSKSTMNALSLYRFLKVQGTAKNICSHT